MSESNKTKMNLDNFTEEPVIGNSVKAKQKKREPSGIAFRMLLLMVIFISLIFSFIFFSFSLFIEDYVQRESKRQLELAVNDIIQNKYSIITPITPPSFQISGSGTVIASQKLDAWSIYSDVVRYLRENYSYSDVNTIIYLDHDYTRIFPDSNNDMLQNLDEADNLITTIHEYDLTQEYAMYKIPASSGDYYLTTINLNSLYEGYHGLSAVFYVNSDKYDIFAKEIYGMLMYILIIAMIFTILYVLLISKSISKPIKKLCSFADKIGHGDFKRSEYAFKDKELIDLNNRMNETAAKLEKNGEEQKIFFQNVSHELKTPLMSIRGYAEGLKYRVFESEKDMNNAADIIIAESERLNDLVADLIYISKIDALDASNNSKIFEMTSKADLTELTVNCVEKLKGLLISQNKINDKKIEILPPPNEIYINCDEESLMRAVMNIIANCVQYAKTTVEISFHENAKGAYLYIKDDGPGIEEKDLPNIFNRFYKGKTGKHGIGLAITKAIIEQHGAKINAGNRIGETGAEFVIEFKLLRS